MNKVRYDTVLDWLVIPLTELTYNGTWKGHKVYGVKGDSDNTILGARFIVYQEENTDDNYDATNVQYPRVVLYGEDWCELDNEYQAGMTCCELVITFDNEVEAGYEHK